jgi:TolB-like protein
VANFSLPQLLKEARRRRVFRVAGLYVVAAWAALQVADLLFESWGISPSALRHVWIGAILGFPVALILGWRYDLSGGRILRVASSDEAADLAIGRTDYVIFIALAAIAIAIAYRTAIDVSITPDSNPSPGASLEVVANSLAVLPFINMSENPENEYFADGISEELLNLLAKIPELQVTSRSSAFSLKGQNLDIPTIAARLNVAHVLEGSVRMSGDQVRITAQLIKADTDTHLWSEIYDRKFENVFAIQDEVAAAVTEALEITLLAGQGEANVTNPEAYKLFLRGQYLVATDPEEAERLLKLSLDIDPEYAPAWYELASLYAGRTMADYETWVQHIPPAREYLEKAVELDPRYADAYAGLAYFESRFFYDFEAASEFTQRAIQFDPGNENFYRMVTDLEIMLGNFDKAEEFARKRLQIHPLGGHQYLGRTLMHAGRFDEAERQFREQLIVTPGRWNNNMWLVFLNLARGDFEAADAEFEFVPEAEEGSLANFFRLYMITLIRHSQGDVIASDAAFNAIIEQYGKLDIAYNMAGICAWRGDTDCAFEQLDKAYEVRDDGLKHLVSDFALESIHDDPRWNEFLDRIGIPH